MLYFAAHQCDICACFRQRSRDAARDASAAASYKSDMILQDSFNENSVSHMCAFYSSCTLRQTTQALHWDRGRPARLNVECHTMLKIQGIPDLIGGVA